MYRVLITGANSYIGTSVQKWLERDSDSYRVDTLDMQADDWRSFPFEAYDTVFHVAGIAHADTGNATEEQKALYYKVNTQLAVETAKKAKQAGVGQFIFMSSMIVYSGCGETFITKATKPKALNFYGDSKLQAEKGLKELDDESFRVVALRPPMIYGKGSKGNYPQLAKMAAKLPVFPTVRNKRSMLHIDNLCEFVRLMIENRERGVFFPQNGEYVNTSDMVKEIARVKGHRIIMLKGMNPVVRLMKKMPGKIGALATKAFGDMAYDMGMSDYRENYRVNSFSRSIELTEGAKNGG